MSLDLGTRRAPTRAPYDEVHAIATAHPRLPIVLWNAFYMDERLQVPLLDACPNVRVGLATVFIPTFGIEQYTARFGPDRLIFGSNWPRQSPGPLLTYVLYADVTGAGEGGDPGRDRPALATPSGAGPRPRRLRGPIRTRAPTPPHGRRDDGPAPERPTPAARRGEEPGPTTARRRAGRIAVEASRRLSADAWLGTARRVARMTALAELALAGRPLDVPIVDCHAHVGPARGIDRPHLAGRPVRLMDRIGIQRSVVSGLMFATGVRLETMNDWVADAIRAHPDRFLGYCYINPNFPEAMADEIERCFDDPGFAGFKLHVSWNGVPYDAERYAPVYEYAAAHRLPILAHTWGDESVRGSPAWPARYPDDPVPGRPFRRGRRRDQPRRSPPDAEPLSRAHLFGRDAVARERLVREVGADGSSGARTRSCSRHRTRSARSSSPTFPRNSKALILSGNAKWIFRLDGEEQR